MTGGTNAAKWREMRPYVRAARHLCLLLYAAMLCIVILLTFDSQHATTQSVLPEITAKVLMVRLTDLSFPEDLVEAFCAGLEASLWSRNYIVAEGVTVKIIKRNATEKGYAGAVEDALEKHNDIFAMVGQFGDHTFPLILPTLQKHNLVSFAPLTGSSGVRGWNPNLYFLRSDPAAELLALIRYALYDLRVLRLGFMYLRGVSFGDAEYEQARQVMSGMGYELSGVFTVKSSLDSPADNGEFNAAWERFADTLPQAVIVFGYPVNDTAKFILNMLKDKRTSGAYLLAPSAVQDLILTVWPRVVTAGVPFRAGQVITTWTNPLAKDTRYEAIRRFQDVMSTYLLTPTRNYFRDTDEFLKSDRIGEMMVGGWLTGEVLSQALGSREWLKNRKSFVQSLFNQRRYVVDELVFGDFGGECSEAAAYNGAMCFCNQGGRTVYMKRYVEDYRAVTLDVGSIVFSTRDCSASFISLLPLVSLIAVRMTDVPWALDASLTMRHGFDAATSLSESWAKRSSLTLNVLHYAMDDAKEALLKEINVRRVHFVAAVVTEAMLDVANVTFIDPVQVEPRLNRFRRHVIRLSPTLEQEFFVIAQYLGNTTSASAHAVVRVSEAAAVADVLRRSLVTFGGSLWSTTLLTGGDALEGHLPREGDVFVVGLSAGDAGVLARHLATYNGVRVFVVFSELAVMYADFVAAFGSGAGADRLVFATSLPHWSDNNTSSLTAQKYMDSVWNIKQRTPLSMMGFLIKCVLQAVVSRIRSVKAELFADFFYKNVAVSVDDMVYGPFADSTRCAVGLAAGGARCNVNYGATSIAVWSLARAVNSSLPVLFPAVTPSMRYIDPNADGLTKPQLTGVVIGSVLGTVLLVVMTIVFMSLCRHSRDNRKAPKEVTDPVTVVFTDIESSTALWAECPEAMPDAVATHHRLIRSLITKYRCYEVKTIGDSFMIACRSVFAAVQLARDIQQVFMHYDWGTTAIDDAYRVFEERRAAEDEEYLPPTARLDAAVYGMYWNGLRVRIGVHTGLCDIRHDAVTKGYDYYGATSNTAARTESVANGGQVLLTRAAYMALSTAEREEVGVTALGAVALRGVPRPVEMYQLDAVPGRTFAALRLEREAVDIDMGSESGGPSAPSTSNNDSLTLQENYITVLLTDLLSPLSLPQRHKMLATLCERWGVSFSFNGLNNKTGINKAAISRLAAKLSLVTARKTEMQRGEQNVEWGSFPESNGTRGSAQYSGGAVNFGLAAFSKPRNRIWTHRTSISSTDSESSTTIVCRPPPRVPS